MHGFLCFSFCWSVYFGGSRMIARHYSQQSITIFLFILLCLFMLESLYTRKRAHEAWNMQIACVVWHVVLQKGRTLNTSIMNHDVATQCWNQLCMLLCFPCTFSHAHYDLRVLFSHVCGSFAKCTLVANKWKFITENQEKFPHTVSHLLKPHTKVSQQGPCTFHFQSFSLISWKPLRWHPK